MNIGQNILSYIQSQAGPLLLVAIIVVGIWFALKRELTKLAGTLVVLIVAAGFVFNPMGVKDLFLNLFNKLFGA